MQFKIYKLKKYIYIYVCFFIYSLSTLCAKLASQQSTFIKVGIYIGLEIGLLGIYAILWQQALKKFSLVTAMSSKGIVVIFNVIWAMLLFQETITVYNIIGALAILYGIWMVSSDD